MGSGQTGFVSATGGRLTAAGGVAVKLSVGKCPTSKTSVTISGQYKISTTDTIESIAVWKLSGVLIKTSGDLTSGSSIVGSGKVVIGATPTGFSNGQLMVLWSRTESAS